MSGSSVLVFSGRFEGLLEIVRCLTWSACYDVHSARDVTRGVNFTEGATSYTTLTSWVTFCDKRRWRTARGLPRKLSVVIAMDIPYL